MGSRVRGVAGVILWLLLLRGTPGRGQSTVDLSVSVTGPPSATVNVSFSYTISVSSVGASTGTTVTDILPPYVQFVSSSLGSACVANSAPSDPSTTVVCSVTTVPSSFTITVNPTVAGSTINVVGIIGNEFDGNMSNNSSSLAVSVTGGSSGGETTNAGFFWTDFDGDGFADKVVYRPGGNSSWYVKRSDGQSDLMVQWGTFGDIPAPGNYGGDGRADYAVFRPSNGNWYVKTAEGTQLPAVQWGASGDIPVPGDYDGDGITDMAVFRPSNGTWYVKKSSGPTVTVAFGTSGDIPVVADFTGDGRADYGIFRPSNATWYVKASDTLLEQPPVAFGASGDAPLPAKIKLAGDAKADKVLWRPSNGTWYVRSAEGVDQLPFIVWGISGDTAMA